MAYSKTNWVGGSTPCSQTNMNHIETGIDQCVDRDGSRPMTGPLAQNIDLASITSFHNIQVFNNATLLKYYQWVFEAASQVMFLLNNTPPSSITMLALHPDGSSVDIQHPSGSGVTPLAKMTGGGNNIHVGTSAPTWTPMANDIWFDLTNHATKRWNGGSWVNI